MVISSCSLANVTQDPENETAPTSTVNAPAAAATDADPVLAPPGSRVRSPDSSSPATRAAAAPPTPLNSATSCGIWVIATRRAAGTPSAVPTTIAARISGTCLRSSEKKVTSTASTAPPAPIWLPRRAEPGEDRPLRARMKQTAATR